MTQAIPQHLFDDSASDQRDDGFRSDLTHTDALHLPHMLRPCVDAYFALLDGRPVLFSESAQKLYELNQTAAYIWCGLLDGKPIDTICNGLESSGPLSRADARGYLQDALRDWVELGLLAVDWKLQRKYAFSVRIGKLTVDIRCSSPQLRELLLPLFSWSERAASDAADIFEVIEFEGLVHLFHNKTLTERCAIDELVPRLKANLTEQIVARCAPDVAFHAACLLSSGKGLLVSGPPGAGKTTLALHLLNAGFEFGSDDIVLIAPDGSVSGVPFAPTIKASAWSMIQPLRPELETAAVHTRPDGLRVRYLDAQRSAYDGSLPIGWIVFLKREADGSPQLKRLGELETMKRLVEGSYAPDGKLNHRAFRAIKRVLATAPSFELAYSNAADACTALTALCND